MTLADHPEQRALLILACGNPSRGDDALGPLLIERLGAEPDLDSRAVEILTDFQLQIEHLLDLARARSVIFVDAAMSGPEPFAYLPAQPEPAAAITTHALSPGALLHLYRGVMGRDPPEAAVLAIRGYEFELGEPLTPRAATNLEQALAFLLGRVAELGQLP